MSEWIDEYERELRQHLSQHVGDNILDELGISVELVRTIEVNVHTSAGTYRYKINEATARGYRKPKSMMRYIAGMVHWHLNRRLVNPVPPLWEREQYQDARITGVAPPYWHNPRDWTVLNTDPTPLEMAAHPRKAAAVRRKKRANDEANLPITLQPAPRRTVRVRMATTAATYRGFTREHEDLPTE